MSTQPTPQEMQNLLSSLEGRMHPAILAYIHDLEREHREMKGALKILTDMRREHEDIYGYEKQHYIIDLTDEWKYAEKVLSSIPTR